MDPRGVNGTETRKEEHVSYRFGWKELEYFYGRKCVQPFA